MSIPDIYWEEKAKLTGKLALEQMGKGEEGEAVRNLMRMTYALSMLRERESDDQ